MQPQLPAATVATTPPAFPFSMDDLAYWVIRRKDGTVIKYTITGNGIHHPPTSMGTTTPTTTPTAHLSDWCKHDPAKEPVWEGEHFDLYIADATGTRRYSDDFDFVLDCGQILTITLDGRVLDTVRDAVLSGDVALTDELRQYQVTPFVAHTKVLRIDWEDRKAPPVKPEFWPAITNKLYGNVLCSCQGGHGRSGTSLVCLLMVCNPDYTPKDAIIHLRAMHCPRAIESHVQHEYINQVGKLLGRVENANEVKDIKDYQKAFLALPYASSAKYQKRLKDAGESK